MRSHTFVRPFVIAAVTLLASTATAQNNVLFIFDASGSMKQPAGGESRIAVAKKAMAQALADVPKDVRLGLLMYGHRRANDCKDIELVSPIGADDAATIKGRIQGVDAKGETPIAEALRQATRSFAALKGQNNSIVLVTDGIEECKGDPCAAAREIKAAGLDIKAHVVGFTLTDQQRKLVQCIPDITGGKYFEAKDASGLNKALGEVSKQTAAAPPPTSTAIKPPSSDDNLFSAANGGRILMAPSKVWAALTDGKEAGVAVYAGEGVWGFKDNKPATFDALEIFVPGAGPYNVKDVELFVGDDGPLGTFRSVGTLTTQNIKMMNSPYQRFTLPPTTARYVKIALKNAWSDDHVEGYEIKLRGKIDEAAAPGPKLAPPVGIDLISPANGGTLVVSRNSEWAKLTNGQPLSGAWATYDGEGVWRFKDGKPATFDRIEVLIHGSGDYNLKDFEVLAGDDGPTGAFRSLGKFTTTNAHLFETPYQVFALPPTTARFLKVVFLTGWRSYISGKGLRLYGKLDEAAAAAPEPPAPAGTDLLAAANGGMLLAAPEDKWKTLTDGTGTRLALGRGSEGIWAFKDEKPAIITGVQVRIPGYEEYILKEFEVLVSTEAPTGPFKSVGTFTTINGVFAASPWQTFMLPPTPARYVKVLFKVAWGDGYIALNGLKIFGTPSP